MKIREYSNFCWLFFWEYWKWTYFHEEKFEYSRYYHCRGTFFSEKYRILQRLSFFLFSWLSLKIEINDLQLMIRGQNTKYGIRVCSYFQSFGRLREKKKKKLIRPFLLTRGQNTFVSTVRTRKRWWTIFMTYIKTLKYFVNEKKNNFECEIWPDISFGAKWNSISIEYRTFSSRVLSTSIV